MHGALHHGLTGLGYELAPLPLLFSYINIFIHGQRGKVKTRWQNYYRADLSQADIVICYLIPRAMKKLQKKFEEELKPGAQVIACAFPIYAWQHVKYDKPSKKYVGLYLYER